MFFAFWFFLIFWNENLSNFYWKIMFGFEIRLKFEVCPVWMCAFSPQRTLISTTVRNLVSLHHQPPSRPFCPVSRRSRWSRIALKPPANVSPTCAPKPPTRPSGCVQPHRSPENNTCWNWPAAVRSPRPAVSSAPPKWLVVFVATLHRPSIRPTNARRRHSIPAVH